MRDEYDLKYQGAAQQRAQAEKELQLAKVQYQELYEQVSSLGNQKNALHEEVGEAHEMISHLESEMNRQVEEHQSDKA